MFVKTRNTTKQVVFLRLCQGRGGKFWRETPSSFHSPPPSPRETHTSRYTFRQWWKTKKGPSELEFVFLCVNHISLGNMYLKVASVHSYQEEAHVKRSLAQPTSGASVRVQQLSKPVITLIASYVSHSY